MVLCAAAIRGPMEVIAASYEKEFGVPIDLLFGGSGTLLSKLQISGADIYLAADSSYTDLATRDGLVSDTFDVAYLTAGAGVRRGNPYDVVGVEDLVRRDLRVGLANPEAASIGQFTEQILRGQDVWEDVTPELTVPTVTELANSLELGTIDVAVIWRVLAQQYEEIDFVAIPAFAVEKKRISAGILTASSRPEAAMAFCRYLVSYEGGLAIFEEGGYEVIESRGRIGEETVIE
ncbi:MAG: molybdate ABC transporter substrate-binding protein [Verrucomicrobiota bacterium]